LTDPAGAVPITFDSPYKQFYNAYGYPVAVNDGNFSELLRCSGEGSEFTATDPSGSGPDWVGMTSPDQACLSTLNTTFNQSARGMSGGPWFEKNGTVGSVTKVDLPGVSGPRTGIAGTYLDSAARAGYMAAGG
jgi:hypothetical protein